MNVPKLRFKEFTEEWTLKNLSQLLEFKNGINAKKEQYGKGIKFVNVLDILNNNYIIYNNIIGRVEVNSKIIDKNSVNYGDILFQRSSETVKEVGISSVYLDKDKLCVFGGFVIRGKKIGNYNPIFMNKLLKSSKFRNEVMSKAGGSTRFNLSQSILNSIKLYFANLKEQEKIAEFLSSFDEKIEIQQQIIKSLQAQKKGLMQKIFSQEIRFKNDNGKNYPKWEEKMLGDCCTIKKGEQINKIKLFEYGDYYVLNGGKTPSGYLNKYNTNTNTISISEGGASCGYIKFNERAFWSGGHCYTLLELNLKCLNIYIFQFIKYKEKNIMNLRIGTGLPNIQKKHLEQFLILIPNIKEQEKIANFLTTFDEKIQIEEQILSCMQKQKKGLLQQMFC